MANERRLTIVQVTPLTFQCSACGKTFELTTRARELSIQVAEHMKQNHTGHYTKRDQVAPQGRGREQSAHGQ